MENSEFHIFSGAKVQFPLRILNEPRRISVLTFSMTLLCVWWLSYTLDTQRTTELSYGPEKTLRKTFSTICGPSLVQMIQTPFDAPNLPNEM